MAKRGKRMGTKNSHKKGKFARYFTSSEVHKKVNLVKDLKEKEKQALKTRHKHIWFIVSEKLEKLCDLCKKIKIRTK